MVILLHATGHDPLIGVNGGIVVLVANLIVATSVSILISRVAADSSTRA
ncbi:hypothetical protein ACFROC_06295 [Nocardia tengchongensis]